MSKEKLKILMNIFFTAQFGYCPLFSMFHNRTLNSKINKLQEKRVLCLIYNNSSSSFSELLEKDNSFTIHHIVSVCEENPDRKKNAFDVCNVKHHEAPKIISE